MAYLNKVMLIGNVGKDPEIRITTAGRKKASFTLATSRRFKTPAGETKEQTEWHNISAWGKLADKIEAFKIRKGDSLFIEGAVNYGIYEKDGAKKYITTILAEDFQHLGSKHAESGNAPESESELDDGLPW